MQYTSNTSPNRRVPHFSTSPGLHLSSFTQAGPRKQQVTSSLVKMLKTPSHQIWCWLCWSLKHRFFGTMKKVLVQQGQKWVINLQPLPNEYITRKNLSSNTIQSNSWWRNSKNSPQNISLRNDFRVPWARRVADSSGPRSIAGIDHWEVVTWKGMLGSAKILL